MFWNVILPLVIYWLMFFVVHYIVLEYVQPYLYDETTPRFELKVAGGSFLLALIALRFRPSFDTMFTNEIHWTAFQALAWVGVFALIYQFQPWHALAIGLIGVVFLPGLATMTADSMTHPRRPLPTRTSAPAGPHRGTLGSPTVVPSPKPGPPAGK